MRGAFIAPDDLGPLPPSRRPLVGEEEVKQLVRALPPPEPDEGSDVAHLVGRERVPRGAVSPLAEELVVLLESPGERSRIEDVRGRRRREGDRGRGRVEVAEVGRARDVVDAMLASRRLDRGGEVLRELVAHGSEPGALLHPPELSGEEGGISEAPEGEEVVPVGMHGLGRVALVADRRRQETVEAPLRRLLVLGGPALLAKGIEVGHRTHDPRPHAPDERAISRVPVVLGDEVDEFAARVVLRHRVGAAPVDGARHLAVLVLVGREPLDELAHLFRVPEPEKGGRGERSVADPGAGIGASPGLDGRPRPVDQDVVELAPERLDRALRGRDPDGHAPRSLPRGRARWGREGGRRRGREAGLGRGAGMERKAEPHLAGRTRGDLQPIGECPRGRGEGIGDRCRGQQLAAHEVVGDHVALVEGGRARAGRLGQRGGRQPPVHAHGAPVERELADRSGAAGPVQGLRRRIHLERAHGQIERNRKPLRTAALHRVAGDDR